MKKILMCLFGFYLGLSFASPVATKSAAEKKKQDEGYSSAVILQYHHVDSKTPASTSVSPQVFKDHLQWLKDNDFQVISIDEMVETLKNKKAFSSNRNVVITFDDANVSVCETAWPILEEKQLPFTVFINTEPLVRSYKSQCKWSTLKAMVDSGLMTVGNHSHTHSHMVSAEFGQGNWRKAALEDINKTQTILEKELGVKPTLFAYPYGEYNNELAKLVGEMGLIGFGQHSGAIGHHSDFTALPRIPAAGTFSNLKTLATKLRSLPFRAELSFSADNPLLLSGNANPPTMTLKPHNPKLLKRTACYDGVGKRLEMDVKDGLITIKNKETLSAGRHRYTCTAPSPLKGRYYWLSHQWLVE